MIKVAVHQYFGMQLRVVGPFVENQAQEWIELQENADEWSVVEIELVATLNDWVADLHNEQKITIMDYDGFRDWRQEWPMTKAEFNKRLSACTTRPVSA